MTQAIYSLSRLGMNCLQRTGAAAASALRETATRVSDAGRASFQSGFRQAMRILTEDLGLDPEDAFVTLTAAGSLALLQACKTLANEETIPLIDLKTQAVLIVLTSWNILDQINRVDHQEHFWQILNYRWF